LRQYISNDRALCAIAMRKNDLILITALALLAALAFFLAGGDDAAAQTVEISVDAKPYGTYPLDTDRSIRIETERGFNLIVIQNGTVRIKDADCPEKSCVRQEAVKKAGESIICVPHRLIVRLGGASGVDAPDAVSR